MEQEDTFLIEGEFAFKSYMPDELKLGMHFLTQVAVGLLEPEWLFFTLEGIPEDEEMFMSLYGAPVHLFLIGENHKSLVDNKAIGWFDDGESEEAHPITDAEITKILNDYNGFMDIESDEDGNPLLFDGKVIISYLSNSDEGEEE